MLKAALAYTKPNGHRPPLPIFPLGYRGKHPRISKDDGGHGCHDATTDPDQIREWWTQFPDANIGIATGGGIIVLDVDIDEEKGKYGDETLRDLEEVNGPLPDTWTSITDRGYQYFFACNDPALTVGVDFANGLDYRGKGGYVVAPPSVHPTGRVYEWAAEASPADLPLAPLPDWLHRLMLDATTAQEAAQSGREIPAEISQGSRNAELFKVACSLRAKGLTVEEMLPALREINKRCSPPLDEDEIKTIGESAGKYERGTFRGPGKITIPGQVKPEDFSDAGTAQVFASRVKDRLYWCDALGWLVWDEKRWEVNEHRATALAIEFAQDLLQDALDEYKREQRADPTTGAVIIPEKSQQYLKFAQKTRNAVAIQHFLSLSKAYLHIHADELDKQWWVLNTEAGMVDLRTGEVQPHDPTAMCTKIAPYSPTTEGAAMWADFLSTITEGARELMLYHQIITGSCAFGRVFHEGITLEVGGGRNGKSTENNALSIVLGDYAGSIDSTALTTDKQNRGAALATLRGKRFVTCGELEEGQRLSVQTLKRLASTDLLTIEEKYKQPETVTPSHHIILFSNFLPRVGSTDTGTWRRLTVIPFTATMPTGKRDIPNFAQELADKAGGAILSWIIEGAKLFYENGYRLPEPPAKVKAATEEYRKQENWLESFLSERCIVEPNARIRCGDLYSDYKLFAASTGDYCRRGADFSKSMEGAGFQKVTVKGKPYWTGVRIDLAQDYGEPRASYY